ncbi:MULTISPECIES: glycerophosphodiester phosphodiesterase family protein [unclassified Rhizobium]|uniref:glycerophosphodiester phosphodiesterase family protein n=1 Tax=unclassified Rhizobium TaxID=2613769 RepID=UPI000EA95B30|nr:MULTISPECIES: glycerophosphodiester phosphodiesterase family protein [unclassified Rhizobium]AYG69076.1 glycerophosphodiester phosphodiesterase [Rhizobium sp. CCGE531]AYG75456.1 glycerophosphodiester phosphodiesterase [Rhizobium sp. CCGE532]
MNYIDYIADPTRDCAVVVHRGIWQAAPENSLLSIERAISAGYDVVEIDVRRSSDGELFLLHDDTLERMAGVDQEPERLTLQQLSSLGLRDRDGGETNPMTGEKLPSLKDVFDLTRDRIFVHLDVKHRAIIPEVIACARAMRVDQQVDFWGALKTREDLAWIRDNISSQAVPFMAKTRLEALDAESQLDVLFQLNPFLCEIYFDRLEQVAERKALFRQAGISLWVNTLNSVSCAGFTDSAALNNPETVWGRLIDAGVSAIQTDEAEALRTYLDARRAPPPFSMSRFQG